MNGTLTNRVALVAGASRGIGAATAHAFANAGAAVALAARDEEAARRRGRGHHRCRRHGAQRPNGYR